METVSYEITSDPSAAISANKRLLDSFQAVQGSTTKLQDVFTHFDAVVGKSTKSFNEIAHVTVNARDKFTSFSNTVENTGITTLRASGAFGELNKVAGDMPSTLLGVASALDNINDKSNALSANFKVAAGSIGTLGTAALIAAAAFTGWKIGTIIGEMTGLNDISKLLSMSLDDVNKKFNPLNIAIRETKEAWQDLKGVTENQISVQEQLNQKLQAQIIAKWGKEIDIAGLSVEEANQKLMEFVATANGMNIVFENSMNSIAQAVASADEVVRQSLLTTGEKLLENSQKIQEAYTKIAQARDAKDAIALQKAEAELIALYGKSGVLRVMQETEKEAAIKRTAAAAKQAAAENQRALEQESKLWGKIIEEMEKAEQLSLERSQHPVIFDMQLMNPNQFTDAQILSVYDQHFAKLQRLEEQEMSVAKAATLAAIAQDQWNMQMEKVDGYINLFSTLESAIPGIGGQIMGFAETFISTGVNLVKNGATTTQAYAGAIGSVLSQIGAQVEGLGGTFLRVGGAVAQGFATGGPWGAVIAGLAAIASELMSFLSHDWGEDVQRTLNNFLPGLELSEQLLEQIAKRAKEAGDAMVGVFLSLPDIIDEVGVSLDNASVLVGELRNGFSLLEQGVITEAQLVDVLNASFADLAKVAPAAMVEIIALTRQFGLEVQAVTDYVNAQIATVVDSANTLADSLRESMDSFTNRFGDFQVPMEWSLLTSGADPSELAAKQIKKIEAQFDTLAFFVSNSIAQIIANGGTLSDVFAQMGPSIDVLRDAWEKFGFDVDSSLMKFLDMQDIITGKLEKTISTVTAVGNGLQALGNLGIAPTAAEFDKFGDSVDKIYHKIIKGGGDQKLALAQIAPQLRIIAQLQAQFGLNVDKGTQKLIDQAREAGLLTDPQQESLAIQEQQLALQETQLDVFIAIAEVLGVAKAQTDAWRASLAAIPDTVDVSLTTSTPGPVPYEPPPPPPGGWGTASGPSYAGITEPHLVSGTERNVTLHDGESVLPKGWSGATYNINISARTKDDAQFVAAVVEMKIQDIESGRRPTDFSRTTKRVGRRV